jgi:hypothetical protein
VVASRISLGAKFSNDFAVYLYAARGDQIFSGTAAGNSGLRENFLQPLKLAWDFGLGNGVDFLVGL